MALLETLEREHLGVTSEVGDSVTITPPTGRPTTFHLVVRARAPRPVEVQSAPRGRWLLYARHIARPTAVALTGAGWSWVSDSGFDLRGSGWSHRVQTMSSSEVTASDANRRPGRPAVATWAVVRVLAQTSERWRQADLARLSGATQGRVSQILSQLRVDGLVERSASGWAATDRRMLADWFRANYPGAGGIETWWYSLDPVMEQVELAATLDGAVISADPAADQIAPWRSPTHAVVYTPGLVNLGPLGFVTASGPGDGSLLVVACPSDTSVFRGERQADPLQVAFDLQRLGGSDRMEAAGRVLDASFEQ